MDGINLHARDLVVTMYQNDISTALYLLVLWQSALMLIDSIFDQLADEVPLTLKSRWVSFVTEKESKRCCHVSMPNHPHRVPWTTAQRLKNLVPLSNEVSPNSWVGNSLLNDVSETLNSILGDIYDGGVWKTIFYLLTLNITYSTGAIYHWCYIPLVLYTGAIYCHISWRHAWPKRLTINSYLSPIFRH